ncbi:hypothetical protein CP960_08390 [Malaciobacter halophilus]|uniref:AB hydrolase-1 domain-containing protein n=1 Tax=Malaciobacter halophilus TaxID=197482 RepID=A0A2N1J1X1_9BACT|nr:alpha/beta hydrolase [Malaciobacter halophilus]AXH10073.1 alpha/beta hydrolase family protein [Malaciobacter halophilus]PKI80559.1 hypothetical protein CP960_08390 [Malaciobacter halophilus]
MKEKIFLLPGLMTDERLWQRVKPLLKEYKLIHIPIPKTTDFDKTNEVLKKLFKDEQKVNLLGFSLGGYIATYFAVNNQDLIGRLFIVAGTPSDTSELEIKRRKQKLLQIQKKGFFTLSYEKASTLVQEQNKEDKQLISLIVDMFTTLGKDEFISQLKSTFFRKDLHNEIKDLNFPLYYFFSTNDRLLNYNSVEKLKKMDSKYLKIIFTEGTSHNIPLEHSLKLAKYIKEWMKTV